MKDKTIQTLIAHRLRKAREESGLSQTEVGEMLDKTMSGYSLNERGKTAVSADELYACSVMFGVPVQDLFPRVSEIPQAFRIIHERKVKEKLRKRKEDLLKELNAINKQLGD